MISRLQKQLRKETPRHSHGYAVLSMLAVMILAGWFVYHGVSNYAQAQVPNTNTTTAVANEFISPRIPFVIADGEYLNSISGVNYVQSGGVVSYRYNLYQDSSSVATISNRTESQLTALTTSELQSIKFYDFSAMLSVSGGIAPIIDSVTINYDTANIILPLSGVITPILNSGEAGYVATFNISISNSDGPIDADILMVSTLPTNLLTTNPTFTRIATGEYEMAINTNSDFELTIDESNSFTVRATDVDGNTTDLTSSLTIEAPVQEPADTHLPDLSIDFVVKVEHGNGPTDPDLPFHFYFFKDNGIPPISPSLITTTHDSDEYSGSIDINNLLEDGTYHAYIKTNKHLSASSNDIVVSFLDGVGPTTQTVDIDFGTLKAGDVTGNSLGYGSLENRDDSVTSFDWQIFADLFGTSGDSVNTLFGDFNNDGDVNAHDIFPFTRPDDGGSYQLNGDLPNGN